METSVAECQITMTAKALRRDGTVDMRMRRGAGRLLIVLVITIVAIVRMATDGRVTSTGSPHANPPPQVAAGAMLAVTDMFGLDGDSLRGVVDGHERELRLWGIDAPERDQPEAEASRAALRALTADKAGSITVVTEDQYERLVVLLTVDGVLVNLAQLEQGHAWWFRRFAADRADFAAAETAAREAGRGLWAQANPEAPWDFRERMRAAAP